MDNWPLLGLFVSAFISSTILPGGSEAVLWLLIEKQYAPEWLLVFVATVGNTLGGLTTWFLGWLLAVRYPSERLMQANKKQAVDRVRRWGSPALLLSWLPIIGDPLCFAAGWLRLSLFFSLVFMAVGKCLRYIFVAQIF